MNSSWEVVEETSVVIEVEGSFRGDSIRSHRNDPQAADFQGSDKQRDHRGKASTDTLTATFEKSSMKKSSNKENLKNHQKHAKGIAKEKPFEYDYNSEYEDYDSEDEEYKQRGTPFTTSSNETPLNPHKMNSG